MIKIQEVSFRYDDEQDENKYALKDISLEVKSGEFVCIIGQNGSGKSTLSKLINAIYPPTSGKVFVGGLDTTDPSELWNIRRTAGMVFQNPDNQMVATIVEEDVAFGAENLGVPPAEIRARVDRALKMVGMYDYRFKSPENLSGGQKQRVAIAGILAMEPQCIVFDESTAMLDPSGRREVLDVIDTLHEAGMTVILVTHHMDEAVRADRVFVMDGGSIVMQGAPKEIFAKPDELRRLRLDIPFAVYASLALQRRGLKMGICLTPEELTGEILKLATSGASRPLRTGEGASGGGNAGADSGLCAEPSPIDSDDGDSLRGANEAEDGLRAKGLRDKNPEQGGEGMTADAVHTAGLSHVYDEGTAAAFAAIRDIDLRVGRGELVGIIGHTGSGKSTFIQHINGLLSPTSGRIVVAGLDITKDSAENAAGKKRRRPTKRELAATQKRVLEIRKKVGLVFQYPEYQLFEETVEKDIMFGPLNLGVSEQDARLRVRESMDIVGLDYDAFAGRSPFDLSGGQKRRVAIAGVLAMQPEVLILDEPTAGLDPQGRDELLEEIRSLHALKSTTILVVSHSMDDMARFAQRILVMSKGQLVLDDTPRRVFAEYELLRSVGLDVPEVCKTLRLLRRSGLCVDPTIVDPEEGIDAIERAVSVAAESFPAEDAADGVPTAQIARGEARGADPELKSAPESAARDVSDSESAARDVSDSEGGEQYA